LSWQVKVNLEEGRKKERELANARMVFALCKSVLGWPPRSNAM
jgi:hypothetical protein